MIDFWSSLTGWERGRFLPFTPSIQLITTLHVHGCYDRCCFVQCTSAVQMIPFCILAGAEWHIGTCNWRLCYNWSVPVSLQVLREKLFMPFTMDGCVESDRFLCSCRYWGRNCSMPFTTAVPSTTIFPLGAGCFLMTRIQRNLLRCRIAMRWITPSSKMIFLLRLFPLMLRTCLVSVCVFALVWGAFRYRLRRRAREGAEVRWQGWNCWAHEFVVCSLSDVGCCAQVRWALVLTNLSLVLSSWFCGQVKWAIVFVCRWVLCSVSLFMDRWFVLVSWWVMLCFEEEEMSVLIL